MAPVVVCGMFWQSQHLQTHSSHDAPHACSCSSRAGKWHTPPAERPWITTYRTSHASAGASTISWRTAGAASAARAPSAIRHRCHRRRRQRCPFLCHHRRHPFLCHHRRRRRPLRRRMHRTCWPRPPWTHSGFAAVRASQSKRARGPTCRAVPVHRIRSRARAPRRRATRTRRRDTTRALPTRVARVRRLP